MTTSRTVTARSLLFVPATAPHRFAKAVASGADLVVVDLEDAVAASDKAVARTAVEQWLRAGGPSTAVRINGVGTHWYADDIALVRRYACPVVLPKADPASVRAARAALGETVELLALVETARGVAECAELCRLGSVSRLAFGALDFTTELGIDPATADGVLGYARAVLVVASAAAGLPPPVDGITPAVHDADALRRDLERSRSTGFGGKLAIHPAQVPVINDAFTPSAAELRWAEQVCDAAGSGDGVTTVDGAMVDLPVLTRARRLRDRARALSQEQTPP
jgi:citrate lyase subunit beta/citryl-CoA lyase